MFDHRHRLLLILLHQCGITDNIGKQYASKMTVLLHAGKM
jgi:hypothetical protein